VQAMADPAALAQLVNHTPMPLHLLKPLIGHTIGASGLLESVILASFLREGQLPPNLPNLFAPPGFLLPSEITSASCRVFKLSHGMGGHNALVALARP
jgi:3-oxoacyl-(acyl-carrier-protein) synthase